MVDKIDYKKEMINIELHNGKYKILMTEDGNRFKALRHNEKWRDLTGDNLMYWLCIELQKAKEKIECAEMILNNKKLNEAEPWNIIEIALDILEDKNA